jgi:predicted peptidase
MNVLKNRNITFALVGILALCASSLFAGDEFAAKEFKGKKDGTLLYRIYMPTNLPKKAKCPLIFVLHGSGHRGNDNKLQISETYGPIELMNYSKANNENAIIIAPQVPNNEQWVNVPWADLKHAMPEKPSDVMQLTMELPVDEKRIYVTGLSMGGYGTWDTIQRKPKLFAAAMPICGGGDTAMAKRIKTIPI